MKVPFDLRIPGADLPAPLRPWVHEYYATGLDVPPYIYTKQYEHAAKAYQSALALERRLHIQH